MRRSRAHLPRVPSPLLRPCRPRLPRAVKHAPSPSRPRLRRIATRSLLMARRNPLSSRPRAAPRPSASMPKAPNRPPTSSPPRSSRRTSPRWGRAPKCCVARRSSSLAKSPPCSATSSSRAPSRDSCAMNGLSRSRCSVAARHHQHQAHSQAATGLRAAVVPSDSSSSKPSRELSILVLLRDPSLERAFTTRTFSRSPPRHGTSTLASQDREVSRGGIPCGWQHRPHARMKIPCTDC
mmetsp:Transcript_8743/g.27480  ORF Transcript_8743/g.27480 Transcript_8743/m.27480 type:complete len:237 (-) Transcript_8743:64-774(-)